MSTGRIPPIPPAAPAAPSSVVVLWTCGTDLPLDTVARAAEWNSTTLAHELDIAENDRFRSRRGWNVVGEDDASLSAIRVIHFQKPDGECVLAFK